MRDISLKQITLSLLALVFCLGPINAQDYKKQIKNANKILGKYYVAPGENKAALDEALASLATIFSADDAKADPESWNSKGQILNEIAKAEMIKKIADPSFVLITPSAGMDAKAAFVKAMDLATKTSHKKDALEGIKNGEEIINNIAITYFQVNDFNNAFVNFNEVLESYELLKSNNEKSRLDDVIVYKDHLYSTAVCGYYGDNKEASKPLFAKLYDMGDAQALVYEALFTLNADTNETKAMEILDAGRKAHPADNGILFAEINYYLKVGKLDMLTSKLKTAIEKEPENVSVIITLGNVYDQLNQKEREVGNIEKSEEYFNDAFKYFTMALEKDPANFDATYSQGALYYNKAASMTTSLNALGNDYSSAGTKKYNALKADMDGLFQQALPYFLKAETLNTSDFNTMIALKEIYARAGQLDKSNEYKKKMADLENK